MALKIHLKITHIGLKIACTFTPYKYRTEHNAPKSTVLLKIRAYWSKNKPGKGWIYGKPFYALLTRLVVLLVNVYAWSCNNEAMPPVNVV
jgi:hypothetical protein